MYSKMSLLYNSNTVSMLGVEPLGSEWTSEAKQWFRSQVDGELVTARVLSVSERGYEVKLEIGERDMAAALISEQLAKAPGAIPETTCVNPELKHAEKAYESQVHQEVQIPGQSGSISKEMPTDGPTVQSDMQLECRCSKDKIKTCDDSTTLNLCPVILFQSHFSQWTGKRESCLSARLLGHAWRPSLVLLSFMCLAPFRVRQLSIVPVSFRSVKLGHFDSHSYCIVVAQWTRRSFRQWWGSWPTTAAVTNTLYHHYPPPLSRAEQFLGLSVVPSSLVRNTFYSIKSLCIFVMMGLEVKTMPDFLYARYDCWKNLNESMWGPVYTTTKPTWFHCICAIC